MKFPEPNALNQYANQRTFLDNFAHLNRMNDLVYMTKSIADTFLNRSYGDQKTTGQKLEFLTYNKPVFLFATLPRSGYNWLMSLVTSTSAFMESGDGTVFIKNDKYTHHVKVFRSLDVDGFFEDSHCNLFHTHMPFYRIKTFAKYRAKKIVLVRDLFSQQISNYFHKGFGIGYADEYFESQQPMFAIDFMNSWGAFSKDKDILLIRFEDLKEQTADTLKKVMGYVDLPFSEEAIHQAIEQNQSIVRQLGAGSSRITSEKKSPFDRCSLQRLGYLISDKLRFDFGYDFEGILTTNLKRL